MLRKFVDPKNRRPNIRRPTTYGENSSTYVVLCHLPNLIFFVPKFRLPIGRLFSLGSPCKNYKRSPNIMTYYFSVKKLCTHFGKIFIGLLFGRFFHSLIRSPCLAARNRFGQDTNVFFAAWCTCTFVPSVVNVVAICSGLGSIRFTYLHM
jgi:hypothetical protein